VARVVRVQDIGDDLRAHLPTLLNVAEDVSVRVLKDLKEHSDVVLLQHGLVGVANGKLALAVDLKEVGIARMLKVVAERG